MQMILMVAEAVAETVGSLIAAALLCWLLWEAFKLMRHPAWAIGAVLLLTVLAIIGALPKSEFLNMAIAFAAVGALPLWIEGRAWRKRRLKDQANAQKRSVI
jgi:drug/metabolite transporter superfamily protein YnfA